MFEDATQRKTLAIIICLIVVAILFMIFLSDIAEAILGSSDASSDGVVIDSARLSNSLLLGNPIIIVKYKFTNNGSEPSSFMKSVDTYAYQDGIVLNRCYAAAVNANYSEENQGKLVKPGYSIYVEVAYEMNSTTADVEIEATKCNS